MLEALRIECGEMTEQLCNDMQHCANILLVVPRPSLDEVD
jgi:hypothetical protein